MRAPLALGLVVVAACGRGEPAARDGAPEPSAAATADAGPDVAPAVRRPTRRYLMTRDGDRCLIGFDDGPVASPRTDVPCPGQLASGERIRMTGKACLRESPADPARDMPVLCPDHLLVLERVEREKARAPR